MRNYKAWNVVAKRFFIVNDIDGMVQNTIVKCEHKGFCECVKTVVCCKHGTACECMEGIDGYEDEVILIEGTGVVSQGQEVYEKDVWFDVATDKHYEVEFVDGAFCLVLIGEDNEGAIEILEVQNMYYGGNLCENPELLKQGE